MIELAPANSKKTERKKEGKTAVKRKGERKGKSTTKGKASKKNLDLDVIQRARASGKPVMFYVHGNCTGDADKACKTMVNLVLRQKAVVTLAKKFHSVEIDASKLDASLGKRYKLVVSPSVVFTDYRGKVLTALPGKQTSQKLLAVMKGVVAENAKRVKKSKDADARKKARSKKK